MSASLEKFRKESDDRLFRAYCQRASAMEETLRSMGVQPSNMPVTPTQNGLTNLVRLEDCIKYSDELSDVAFVDSQGCMKLIDKLTAAIQNVVKSPLRDISNDTINGLSEVVSKKALGLAIKGMYYQAKQIHIFVGERAADYHLVEHFKKQREIWETYTQEVGHKLSPRSGEEVRISALEEALANRTAEVQALEAFMKMLSKRLHKAATGSSKLPKELRKCEKSAMESSAEKIISVVQAERDALKDLQAKLHEADAKKQELQQATKQLHDDMAYLRRQLNEAVAEKTAKENEIDEVMEKRIRCSVCMDRDKDTVFVCGHAHCNGCASEWRKCTVCVTEKGGRPITFRHPLFL